MNKKLFSEITDEVIEELDVRACNIDERTHDPPMKNER